MKRLERLAAALTPKRWPVRWRLAAVSAGLTFLILVIFALVVGRLTSSRLHGDFNQDLRNTAVAVAGNTHLGFDALPGNPQAVIGRTSLIDRTAAVRVVLPDGTVWASQPPHLPSVGPPDTQSVHEMGDLAVAAAPVPDTRIGPLFIEYSR